MNQQLTDFQKFAVGDAQYQWTTGEFKGIYEDYKQDDKNYIYFMSGRKILKTIIESHMRLSLGHNTNPYISNNPQIDIPLGATDKSSKLPLTPKLKIPTMPEENKDTVAFIESKNERKPELQLEKFKKLLDISNSEDMFELKSKLPSKEIMIMMEILDFNWKELYKIYLIEKIDTKLNEL